VASTIALQQHHASNAPPVAIRVPVRDAIQTAAELATSTRLAHVLVAQPTATHARVQAHAQQLVVLQLTVMPADNATHAPITVKHAA